MADEAERAELSESLARDIAIQTRKPEGPVLTGFCANCGESIAPLLRWCDSNCRDDWSKRTQR